MERFAAIADEVSSLTGTRCAPAPQRRVTGGSINECYFWPGDAGPMFEKGAAGPECEARLGRELAALHAVTAPRFGWARDNTIGRTPQLNAASEDWAEFFRERRLRPQLQMAAAHGFADLPAAAGERLLESVQGLLAGHRPSASLLHGDLWGGNWLAR